MSKPCTIVHHMVVIKDQDKLMTNEGIWPMDKSEAIEAIDLSGNGARVYECEIGGMCRDITVRMAEYIAEQIYLDKMRETPDLLAFIQSAGVDRHEIASILSVEHAAQARHERSFSQGSL